MGSGDQIILDDLEYIPDLKCVLDLERVLDNMNAILILNILFKNFRSIPLQIAPTFLRIGSMHSFFFWSDGINLDCSVRSCERTIIPQERCPALV